jgi:hypothetical protein
MSRRQKKSDTLAIVLSKATVPISQVMRNAIEAELRERVGAARVSPERRMHLLQVFHSCRALESAMKEIVRTYINNPANSIGDLLQQLSRIPQGNAGHIDVSSYNYFMRTVRNHRNRYMHEANAFPTTSNQANQILSDIEACFVAIVK